MIFFKFLSAVNDPHVKRSIDGVWYQKDGERVRNRSPGENSICSIKILSHAKFLDISDSRSDSPETMART